MNFAGRNRGASWDRISLLQLALSQNLLRGTGFWVGTERLWPRLNDKPI